MKNRAKSTKAGEVLFRSDIEIQPKVFMVSRGDYSDYHVCCICSTMEKAEEAKKYYAADRIDEYLLDAIPKHPDGMYWYRVKMDEGGNTSEVGIRDGDDAEALHAVEYRYYGDGKHVCFYMFAKDEQHAVKIANERRAMLLAAGPWPGLKVSPYWNILNPEEI